jgi:hypothetical protein
MAKPVNQAGIPCKPQPPFPFSPEMGMVVPDHQLPLPIVVFTHAEGRVFQDKKMMDVIKQSRTDVLPRHHAADQHTHEGPVCDDEQGPLRTLHKIVQGSESTRLQIKEILFIGMFDTCIRPMLGQKLHHLQCFRRIPSFATYDGRANNFVKQRVVYLLAADNCPAPEIG